jgi:hypothetical protein
MDESPENQANGVVVAFVPPNICSPTRLPWPPPDLKQQMQQALDWQQVGAEAQWQGFAGHMASAPDPIERLYELAGLQAAIGEQLGLACTICYELDCWKLSNTTDAIAIPGQEMAVRALLDLLAFYLVSIGHALANVVVRVLALHPETRDRLERSLKTNFPPLDESRRNWPSLERSLLNNLLDVCSGVSEAEGLLPPVQSLALETQWSEVAQWRAEAFHRWRPQSRGIAGTPKRRWGVKEKEAISYGFSGTRDLLTSENSIDSEKRSSTLRQVLDDVVNAMQKLDVAMAKALTAFTKQAFTPNASRGRVPEAPE